MNQTALLHTPSLYVETYGCQMNKADSELIVGLLAKDGYQLTEVADQADVILVNTCAIREHAEQRVMSRMAELNHLKAAKPDLIIGLCGCMSQHLGEKLLDKAPYIDLVVGPDGYRQLPELLRSLNQTGDPALSLSWNRMEHYLAIDPIREAGVNGWITIMRGCDKMCSFCIVPFVRGRERSTPYTEILRQVERLVAEGYKEVTLLGQTVNKYQDGAVDFAALLDLVAGVGGIERIRFTSPHPSHFPDHLIDTMARHPQVCPHTHLPLQSGSTPVLERMKRDYTADQYLDVVRRLRSRIPHIALTTDIIVGFCGETEQDFQATYELMEQVGFDAAFMFKYSPRSGTAAYKKLDDTVPEDVKSQRLTAIIDLQKKISEGRNRAYIGQTVPVLIEGQSKRHATHLFGKADTFKTVVFPERPGLRSHLIVPIHITHVSAFTLFGEAATVSDSSLTRSETLSPSVVHSSQPVLHS